MKMNCCFLSQIVLMVTLLLSGQWTKAQDLELEEHWWQPNGTVNSIVKDGNTVYLGGNFTYIGPDEPYGAAINTSTGTPDFTYLNPNGTVNAAISDGMGGWYIGGDFTQVGGQPRSRIAQLNSSGQLTAFGANQGFNGSVNSLVLNNGTLYAGGFFNSHGTVSNGYGVALDNGNGVPDLAYLTPNGPVNAVVSDGMGGWFIGGQFTQVGGQDRVGLARINADGTLHPWNPNCNGAIYAIALSGSTVYVGGSFSSIGGQNRSHIAALDSSTGNAFEWNPGSNGIVRALVVSGSSVYVGGDFTWIGEQYRWNIASLDTTSGNAAAWDPNANGQVLSLAISDGILYAGGVFNTIGGQVRNCIAALNTVTGAATAWNPFADDAVFSLSVIGSAVYAGGQFTMIGGQNRNFIAELDDGTGNATAWNPNANSRVHAISVIGGTLYAGGDFSIIGGQSRNRIAAIDVTTGNATAWNPNATSTVSALSVSGSAVYVGGQFSSIGGQNRNNLAALDATTGLVTAWNPDVNGFVYSIALSNNTLYVGGGFSIIGGQNRNNIAALDATTGIATTWNPSCSGVVRAITLIGSTVFVGGIFSSAGGQTRNNIAAINATTGTATAWNPNANGVVYTLALNGSTVYAGGYFTNIGGQNRNYIAAINSSTGIATTWNPNADNEVRALSVSAGLVYAGGSFTTIGGQMRNKIAALDASTGTANSWNPNGNGGAVIALSVSGSMVYAGGSFNSIGGQTRNYLVALNTNTGIPTTWNPNANSMVYALELSGSTIFTGGLFTSIGGQTRNRIAAINTSTGAVLPWNPNANSWVFSLLVNGNTVYAGGDFTSIGGQTRNRIAALNATTGLATSWNPNANSQVYAIKMSGSSVYAGGNFTIIGGQSRNKIAAIDATTASATSWNPNADGQVRALALSGSNLYVGGAFSSIGGQSRGQIAAIDVITGYALPWNPNASNSVHAIAVGGSNVYVGGLFVTIGGQSRKFVAAININTGEVTSWDPKASSNVNSIVVNGNKAYLGGDFTVLNGKRRRYFAVLNQLPPTITSFSPLSAKPGDVVTITGTGFNTTASSNVVYFGATKATVSSATATSITVTVPTGATFAPITVLNSGSTLSCASSDHFNPIFTPAKPNITPNDFMPKVDFAAGFYPTASAVGDIDGDGKSDLAIVNYSLGTVSVYRNIATSGIIDPNSFAPKVDFITDQTPWALKLADLDLDGKLDLVLINNGSNSISVFRNNAIQGSITSSSFEARVDFLVGMSPYSVEVGDMDFDGKPDLVVSNSGDNTVTVLKNTSTLGILNSSSFQSGVSFSTGSGPYGLALGDVDGDGKLDIVTANRFSNDVSVLRNQTASGVLNGSSIAGNINYAVASEPYAVTLGDLDVDGKLDIIAANAVSNCISVLKNNAISGTIAANSFAAKVDFFTATRPISVEIADFNGDAKPDVVTTNLLSNSVSVFRNTSTTGSINTGSFATRVDFTTGSEPGCVTALDADGDSKLDMVVTNLASGTFSILRNADLLPSISSYTPTSGCSGSTVTLSGTNFTGTTSVNIGGTAVTSYTVNSSSEIVLTVGSGNSGSIQVVTPNGSVSISSTFTLNPSITWYLDADNDGYYVSTQSSCTSPGLGWTSTMPVNGANDCNDNNALLNSITAETCNNFDDDCDGTVDNGLTFVNYYNDTDGDGYGSGTATSACQSPGASYVTNNTDCNDGNALLNSISPEICNNFDDDCDGTVDNGLNFVNYYNDQDGDGYGAGTATNACSQPANTVTNNTDCNDNNALLNSITAETCNNFDDDCDGTVDNGLNFVNYYNDQDGDGYGAGTATNACSQPLNTVTNNTDCNDNNAALNSITTETCNSFDDDCDGTIDNGLTFVNYYNDQDGDGYGAGTATNVCSQPANTVTNNSDCNDGNPSIQPGATEICGNNIDEDCSGLDLICPGNGDLNTVNVISIGNYGTGTQTTLSVNFGQGADNVESPGTGIDRWYQFTAQANAIRIELIGNATLGDDNDIALYDYTTTTGQPLIPLTLENDVTPLNMGISTDGGNEILYYDQLEVGSTYWICVRNLNSVYGTASLKLSYLRGSAMDIGAYTNYTNTYSSTCQNFKCKFKPGASYYTFNLWDGNTAQGTANWMYSTTPTTTTTATTVVQLGKLVGANINNAPVQHTVKVDAHYALKDAYGNTEQVVGYGTTPGVFTMNTEADLNLRTTDRCPVYKSPTTGSMATNRSVCGTTRYIWELTMIAPMAGLPQTVNGPIGGSRVLAMSTIQGIASNQQYNVSISSLHVDQQTQSNYGTTQCMRTYGFAGAPIVDESENDNADQQRSTQIQIYPNPNGGDGVVLNINGMEGETIITITDAMGREIEQLTKNIDGDYFQQVITFQESLSSGLYQMTIKNGAQVQSIRMVVSR